MLKGFVEFLQKWGVIGLAIAVIIGGKLNEWVSALVADIIMPLIGLVLPGGSWREFTISLGGDSQLLVGHFLGATVDFLIIVLVVYLAFTYLLKNISLSDDLEAKLGREKASAPPPGQGVKS
ncbi:MAG: MscL family protein [Ardenticatenales bacterium]|nr:MscL family protein [Ardenticatenales bacterium]